MPTILVVDDEPHLTFMLAHRLRAAGVEVVQANDGNAGLAAALKSRPSLVISDYHMPGMTGTAMCSAIRAGMHERYGTTPAFIVVTGRGHRIPQAELDELSAFRVLAKPFSMQELIDLVQDALGCNDLADAA